MQTLISRLGQSKEYLDRIRKVAFVVSLILIIIIVSVELANPLFTAISTPQRQQAAIDLSPDALCGSNAYLSEGACAEIRTLLSNADTRQELTGFRSVDLPGWGISTLAFIDGIVLFTTLLIATSYLIPAQLIAKVQGILTLIVALIVISLGVVRILTVYAEVLLMIALLLSVPFGTLIYLAKYGSFDVSTALAVSTWLFSLKISFGVCLVIAQERYLQNKGLVLIFLTALFSSLIVKFLHSFVPGILVSITDGIAAIVVAILAVLWAIFLLIGSLISIIKAIQATT